MDRMAEPHRDDTSTLLSKELQFVYRLKDRR
jgi:hypothetical protein